MVPPLRDVITSYDSFPTACAVGKERGSLVAAMPSEAINKYFRTTKLKFKINELICCGGAKQENNKC